MAYPKIYPKVATKTYPKAVGAINSFNIEIDTTKTEVGSSVDTAIIIPLVSGVAYDCVADMGDNTIKYVKGSSETSITHTYAVSGVYEIKIWGVFPRIFYNNAAASDRLKITKINNWGNNKWSSMVGALYGCSNLVDEYSDVPDFSAVVGMGNAWRDCELWNGTIENANCDLVEDWGRTWQGADAYNQKLPSMPAAIVLSNMLRDTIFNQNMDNITMENVTAAVDMLRNNTAFNTANFSSWLAARNGTAVNSGVTAHFGAAQFLDQDDFDYLDITKTWTITSGGAA